MNQRERIEKAFGALAIPVYQGEELIGTSTGSKSAPTNGRITVLLTGSNIELSDALAELEALKLRGFALSVVMSSAAKRILGTSPLDRLKPFRVYDDTDYDKLQALIKSTDILIAPNLTQNHLAKCAVGVQDDLPSVLLWQSMVTGVKVIVNVASIMHGWFCIDQNKAMKKVMEGHLKTVTGFGAHFIDHHDYGQLIICEEKRPPAKGKREERKPVARQQEKKTQIRGTAKSAHDRLISEQSLRQMGGVKEITVRADQLLTPLAKDYCISKGIEIVYERRTK